MSIDNNFTPQERIGKNVDWVHIYIARNVKKVLLSDPKIHITQIVAALRRE
jgi:hypothetical protein